MRVEFWSGTVGIILVLTISFLLGKSQKNPKETPFLALALFNWGFILPEQVEL